jgi:G:T-mismatch repair DNA endonuclease (very short patch repair protein)
MAPKKSASKKVARPVKIRRIRSSVKPSRKVIRKVNRKREPSGLEREIHHILIQEQIPFITEKTIGSCHADIFLHPKVVIELNGCYWHGCPKCTKKPKAMHLLARTKDASRYAFFMRLGFEVFVIWECELKNNPEGVRKILRTAADKAATQLL